MASKLTQEDVQRELRQYTGRDIDNLEAVNKGHFSEGWFYSFENQQYIIRFAHPQLADSLRKDHYISTKLVSPKVPIARFIHLAVSVTLESPRHYAISERAPGIILDELSADEYEKLIPELVSTLHQIHQSDISHTQGWGAINLVGTGQSASWAEFLLDVAKDTQVHGRWHRLFDDSFLEEELYSHLFKQLNRNLHFCPEERWLLHADYGFDNVLAKDNHITAVIDWANALYGDFIFDVARQHLLQPEWAFLGRFTDLYEQEGIDVPHLSERVNCYQCYFVLDAMRFYASIDSLDGYKWIKHKAQIVGLM